MPCNAVSITPSKHVFEKSRSSDLFSVDTNSVNLLYKTDLVTGAAVLGEAEVKARAGESRV